MSSPATPKPLTTNIKCLIVINENKYKIVVDNDFNDITFNEVLTEIRKQIDTKQDISHETHTFEIFDVDFNEYVMITSDELVIENLSRIRVSPKRKSKWSQTESQCFDSENKSCDTIGLKASTSYKPVNAVAVTPFKPLMVLSPIAVSPLKLLNTTKSMTTSITTTSPPKTSVTNIKNTVITNSTINGITPSILPETDPKFRCQALLAQFVHRFHSYFSDNHQNQTNAWQMVSNEMIKNGFKDYTGMVCKKEFNNINSVYVQTLQTATNYKTACAKYQLFAKLNAMDLKFFMNPSTYEKVVELRKSKFNMKFNKNKSLIANQALTQPSVQKPIQCKHSNLNKVQENQNNFIVSETQPKVNNKDNKVGVIHRNSGGVDRTLSQQTVNKLKHEKIVTVLPNLKRESFESDGSENKCDFTSYSESNNKTESETNIISVKYNSSLGNIELPQTAINSVLIACVKRNQELLCDTNTPLEELWIKVSANMKDFHCPQNCCTPKYCREVFTDLLSQMKAILQFADTVEKARNMFALFDELSSLNLNRFLPKKAIDEIFSLKNQTESVCEESHQIFDLSID